MNTKKELFEVAEQSLAINKEQQDQIRKLQANNDDLIALNKKLVAEVRQQDEMLLNQASSIKELQAEVERLKSEPAQTVKEVLKQLKVQAETTSNENPPTDDSGGRFDAIWMTDLNGLIEEASWQFQEQAND